MTSIWGAGKRKRDILLTDPVVDGKYLWSPDGCLQADVLHAALISRIEGLKLL